MGFRHRAGRLDRRRRDGREDQRVAGLEGALVTAVASLAQILIPLPAAVEHPLAGTLIFLLVVGIVGGRWGLGLSTRQLCAVVLGSFLFAILAGFVALYLTAAPRAA